MTDDSLIPEAVRSLTDEQKRAFAAAYWMGVCVGELVNLGMSEEDVREGFEKALSRALEYYGPIGETS